MFSAGPILTSNPLQILMVADDCNVLPYESIGRNQIFFGMEHFQIGWTWEIRYYAMLKETSSISPLLWQPVSNLCSLSFRDSNKLQLFIQLVKLEKLYLNVQERYIGYIERDSKILVIFEYLIYFMSKEVWHLSLYCNDCSTGEDLVECRWCSIWTLDSRTTECNRFPNISKRY